MDFIKRLNIPMACLIVLTLKVLVTEATIADALALSAAAGLFGYRMYLDIRKDSVLLKINEQIVKMSEEFQHLHTQISTIKMQIGLDSSIRKLGSGNNSNEQKENKPPKRFF